jgi:hypothetical protein
LSQSGTHSPLDIHSVADSATDFCLFPLSPADCVHAFGKERVTFEGVDNQRWIVGERHPDAYERWQAVYVPVYTGNRLTHAYVEGASGD